MNRFPFLVILVFFYTYTQAQDMERVRATVDTLSSYEMGGRGASGEGDKKAAVYLTDRFSSMKLS
jgi:hypothetical protein